MQWRSLLRSRGKGCGGKVWREEKSAGHDRLQDQPFAGKIHLMAQTGHEEPGISS